MSASGAFIDTLRRVKRTLLRHTLRPAVGRVDLGSLDRVTPVSRNWGFDRGTPVDRLYIERFLDEFRADVQGRVLEVADRTYTERFGGARVTQSDVLSIDPADKNVTLVFDLADTADAPPDAFDCIVCTQTVHLVYDLRAALASLHRMLRPGGTLLLTGPAITPISRWDMDRHGDHWRFTSAALRRLVGDVFVNATPVVRAYGNVYAATAFLHGLAVEELDAAKLAHFDVDYEMLVGVRVQKAAGPA